MPTQQSFLGASIISFTGSVGWGGTSSSLYVTLVEDKLRGDDFTAIPVGTPTNFRYVGDDGYVWNFCGLIQNYKYSRGSSGYIYTAQLEDPRSILEGVNVILDGFAERVSVNNILNVYGYLENIGFGHSEKNGAGIPWKKIRDAITNMCNSNGNYGRGIFLRNARYKIDLSELPNIDENFRVGGQNISMSSFIAEVCEAGSHDYFVEMELLDGADYAAIIRVKTASRNSNPTPGLLTSYLSTVQGVVSSEAGIEFRNEAVGKFLVGPPIIEMFSKSKEFEDDANDKGSIQPFWGFKDDFSLIRPSTHRSIPTAYSTSVFDNDHVVRIPCEHLRVPEFRGSYYLEIGELRRAYESKESWLDYLEEHANDEGATTVQYPSSDPYRYPHQGKYKIVYGIDAQDKTVFTDDGIIVIAAQQNTSKDKYKFFTDSKENDDLEKMNKIYNFVKNYADNYYGTKFTLSLPALKITKEPESLVYRTSKIPVDGGFFLPAQWSGAISSNKLPHDYNRLMSENGKFYPFARFDDVEFLDFSQVPQTELVFNSGRTSIFVKCAVENAVTFENIYTSGGPCAVFTLPAPIRKVGETKFGEQFATKMSGIYASSGITYDAYQSTLKQFGVDTLWRGVISPAVMPDFVCIPLQDNENRYGPWWKVTANGKVDYETDESLGPWNYGGYDLLDRVAFARVSQMDSTMVEAEAGSIQVAGTPAMKMGAQLVSGGPYITDIQVSIGQDGVTTTYRFSTWSKKIAKLSQSQLDRIERLKNTQKEQEYRTLQRSDKFVNREFSILDRDLGVQRLVTQLKKDKIHGGTTSHGIISGDAIIGTSGTTRTSVRPNSWVQPFYNFTAQLDEENYRGKAGVSIDGLFRPFSTDPSGVNYGLPSFVRPTQSGEPNVDDLNPYRGRHDINVVIRGSSYVSDLSTIYDSGYFNETDYRAMALRGPLVVAGWGYDTDGLPIPNESGAPFNSGTRTRNFYPDYKLRQDLWPAGPVDMRWNRERGVWEAGGGGKTKIVKLVATSGIFPNGFQKVYLAEEMSMSFPNVVGSSVTSVGTGEMLYVGNFRHNIASSGGIYVAHNHNGQYYIDNQLTFFGGIL